MRAGEDEMWLWDHEWPDPGSGLFAAPVKYLEEAVNLFEKVKADLRGAEWTFMMYSDFTI